ncbi:hypothetical protein LTR36_001214 [Oleoguttula mirabilis]|uniref:Uncharacterized protein n=1 Tax=Oleoguttula mirabilis TaxID=1507867 RepID=A0AAV9JNP6_9PEZI|nr:hypothetical protein LTR36_001214 [Oleoguttula mirabilis]
MEACVAASNAKLGILSEQIDKYNSLGSHAPKETERVRYIAHNLDPQRDELRRSRQEIDTQLELCNTDALGKILKIVSERAADERAGRRQTVISGGGADEDDVLSVITQDLSRHRIPESDIQTHRPDIEACILELRVGGAFGEEDEHALTELDPSDSVSQFNVSMSTPPIAKHASHSSFSTSNSIELFRGVHIQDISYHTIVNPHISLRGISLPGTCDIWGLAESCWALQKRIMRGFEQWDAAGMHNEMAAVMNELSAFDPVLLLALADSSVNKKYWRSHLADAGMEREMLLFKRYYTRGCQSLPDSGTSMVKLLRGIDQELDRWESFGRGTKKNITEHLDARPETLKLPEPRDSSFTRFKKSIRRSSSAHSGRVVETRTVNDASFL